MVPYKTSVNGRNYINWPRQGKTDMNKRRLKGGTQSGVGKKWEQADGTHGGDSQWDSVSLWN